MNDFESYYDILEISKSVTQDEVKKAFYKLAQEYHPDKSSKATDSVKKLAEERFKEINEAYCVLKDVGKRRQYDAKLKEFEEKKQPPKTSSQASTQKSKTQTPVSNKKLTTKQIAWIVIGILVFIGILSNGNSNSNQVSGINSTNTQTNNTYLKNTNTDNSNIPNAIPVVVPKKSNNQICLDTYSTHSSWSGKYNTNGTPTCACINGYQWTTDQKSCVAIPKTPDQICKDKSGIFATYNSSDNTCGCESGYDLDKNTNQCVTQLQYCQNLQGLNATYNSTDNTCGCEAGYYYGAVSKQCISLVASRDEMCSVKYSNTSFLKYSDDGKTNICDCNTGYYWNNDKTSCVSQTTLNQQCINSYGTGSYSTTQNGQNVCDCSYGYSFNAQRNACVTTSSIDQICVRDVGRNSYYQGTVTDGKYNCSSPY